MTVQSHISYRYFGDTSCADQGVVTAATRLDRDQGKVHVGLCLTPPKCRFDKAFSRSVALYRLNTLLAQTPEEFRAAEDALSVDLSAMQDRVHKVFKRTRRSFEDYQQRKATAMASRIGSENINIGYYDYEIQHYTVADIAISKDCAFSTNIEIDAAHDEIDTEIIDVIANNDNFLPWVESLFSNEEDEEYKDAEAHNENFEDIRLVHDDNGYFLTDLDNAHDRSYMLAISPVKSTREELKAFLESLLHTVEFAPAIEADNDPGTDECLELTSEEMEEQADADAEADEDEDGEDDDKKEVD